MSSLPKSLNILGVKVKIKYTDQVLVQGDKTLWGYYDPNDRSITIYDQQSAQGVQETLYHEFGHALLDLAGITVTSLAPDLQEVIVEQYARFMFKYFVPRGSKKCRK